MLKTLSTIFLTLSLSLLLTACDNNSNNDSATTVSEETLSECTGYIEDPDFDYQECATNRLSFIGQASLSPTVDDIMNRVITQHPWMAENFRAVLQEMPIETLKLFRSVTAIVIDSRIRPSFFDPQTAAIYLDPEYLWITANEHQTMAQVSDYRASYSSGFNFFYAHQYIDDNDRAVSHHYAYNYPDDRPASETFYGLSRLLFHELAHANDAYPIENISSRPNSNETPLDLIDELSTSDLLDFYHPLNSDDLYAFASVTYWGHEPNSAQLAYSAEDIGYLLQQDSASGIYNYSTHREDSAMLFEEFAMLFFLNVRREITLVNYPDDEFECMDLDIGWGQTGRIKDPKVLERALFVASRLMPEMADEFVNFSELLDGSTQIEEGQNWCASYFDY